MHEAWNALTEYWRDLARLVQLIEKNYETKVDITNLGGRRVALKLQHRTFGETKLYLSSRKDVDNVKNALRAGYMIGFRYGTRV